MCVFGLSASVIGTGSGGNEVAKELLVRPVNNVCLPYSSAWKLSF